MVLKVLVTGAEGQVGSAVMSSLGAEYQCIGLSRAELDLTSPEAIARAMDAYQPDVVVNAAAYTAVDRAEDEPELAFQVNAEGPRFLAEACLKAGAVLIHFSTDYVFDGSLIRPARETDPCVPVGVYGRSKLAGEEAIRQTGVRHLCVRTSWVFSATGACFPRTILRAAKQHDVLRVVNDQVGAPTSAVSLARVVHCVLARLAAQTEIAWGTYHFAQKPQCSWFEFAQAIVRIATLEDSGYARVVIEPISTEAYGARAPRPSDSRLDTDKITGYLSGLNSFSSWESDLRDAISQILTIEEHP